MAWVMTIDPGVLGGISRCCNGVVSANKMPKTMREISDFFATAASDPGCERIVLEQVWSRETDSKRSATTFMRHVGFLVGCIYSSWPNADDLLIEVPPSKWQKDLGCPKMSRDKSVKHHLRKSQHKRDLKDMAIRLYPDLPKITLATCDALLLMSWCREFS